MSASSEVRKFRQLFREQGRPERAAGEKAYLKSELKFSGVTIPQIRKAAKNYRKENRELEAEELWALCQALWETPYYDLRRLACALLDLFPEQVRVGDLPRLEHFLRHSKTWALVDALAVEVVGGLVSRRKGARRVLSRWARDDDFWIRRSALLALLRPVKNGEVELAVFEKLAVPMLAEKEFFIRKAIGWVLRDVSRTRAQEVESFLERHGPQCSGLTFREASKHLPSRAQTRLAELRASPA